jgi:hypothetical protein
VHDSLTLLFQVVARRPVHVLHQAVHDSLTLLFQVVARRPVHVLHQAVLRRPLPDFRTLVSPVVAPHPVHVFLNLSTLGCASYNQTFALQRASASKSLFGGALEKVLFFDP